jgi:hypothetical protein
MNRQIPESWVERLFSRMASLWGSRFADKWRDCDLDEVKSTWRLGLSDLADPALKRGVAALFNTPDPPDLPAFRRLCQAPAPEHQGQIWLGDGQRTLPAEAREQLARIAALVDAPNAGRRSGIAWARRILQRALDGERITAHQVQFARQAIEIWERTHGRREPGSDDE